MRHRSSEDIVLQGGCEGERLEADCQKMDYVVILDLLVATEKKDNGDVAPCEEDHLSGDGLAEDAEEHEEDYDQMEAVFEFAGEGQVTIAEGVYQEDPSLEEIAYSFSVPPIGVKFTVV